MTYAGRGRRARYCSQVCRQRAWAPRTAERQLGTEADARPRVVREIVDRERIVIRHDQTTAADRPRINPPAPMALMRAREWVALLAELEQQLVTAKHPLARQHWDHPRLYAALVHTVTALGHAHPGARQPRLTRSTPSLTTPPQEHGTDPPISSERNHTL
ncbi:MAG: hypothetical protein ACRDR6_10880 [Pseudonocardiaceae bacterium]